MIGAYARLNTTGHLDLRTCNHVGGRPATVHQRKAVELTACESVVDWGGTRIARRRGWRLGTSLWG